MRKWLPEVGENLIQVLNQNKTHIGHGASVIILGYDKVQKIEEEFKKWKPNCFIVDEAHYLKNNLSIRTQIIAPFLQKSKRTILIKSNNCNSNI